MLCLVPASDFSRNKMKKTIFLRPVQSYGVLTRGCRVFALAVRPACGLYQSHLRRMLVRFARTVRSRVCRGGKREG